MIRLIPSQQCQIKRSTEITFTFGGASVTAHAGESVSAALLRNGIRNLCNQSRGMFCCMGLCQECLVLIDNCAVEACRVPAAHGLVVMPIDSRRGA